MSAIDQIKANWTTTDNLVYGDNAFEVKFKSLEEAKTKVISKN